MLSAMALHRSQVDTAQRKDLRAMLDQHAWRLFVRVRCITFQCVLQLSHRGLPHASLQVFVFDDLIPRCVIVFMSCSIGHEYQRWTFVTISLLITKTEFFTQCFGPATVTDKATTAKLKCNASEVRFSLSPQLHPCRGSAMQCDCHSHCQQKKKKPHAKQGPQRLCAGHFDKRLRVHCDLRNWLRGGYIKYLTRRILN